MQGERTCVIVAPIDLTGVLGMNSCPGQHQARPKRPSMASLLEMPHLAGQRIQHGHTWQLGSVTLPNHATARLPAKRRKTVCRDREAQKVPQCPSALLYSPTLFFTFLQSVPQAKSLADCPFLGSPFSLEGMRCYKEKLEALSVCSVMWSRKKKVIKTHTTQLQFHHERSPTKN